jgi:hypothetical protein
LGCALKENIGTPNPFSLSLSGILTTMR